MEMPMKTGNAGEAARLDDGSCPRRTGTASAHIINAVIGSGVLSLAWAIAQLGWVSGPAAILLFCLLCLFEKALPGSAARGRAKIGVWLTTTLLTAMFAWRVAVLMPWPVTYCNATLLAIASSITMSSSSPYMIIFGVVLFWQILWPSTMAAVMPVTYSSTGLSLGIAQTIFNGGFMGSLPGISIGAGINSMQKICSSSSYVLMIEAIPSFMLCSACLALAEYMCIWITMLPPACRIGTRAPMPTTGAVKGSGMLIGRAREAGCSHVIPTAQADDDCSPPPHECDWSGFMESAIINRDKSCVISAVLMCMEALYRRNENFHGAISCFLKVRAEAVKSLKDMCVERGAWKPYVGAPTVKGVLDVIRSLKKGIPTVHDNISLRLKSYVPFKDAGELSPLEVTSLLHKMGPVVGVLYVDGEYFRSTVYRGDRGFPANHTVVCTGCRYLDGELYIRIMDNVAPEGPVRYVLHKAFQEFHVLTVDAS